MPRSSPLIDPDDFILPDGQPPAPGDLYRRAPQRLRRRLLFLRQHRRHLHPLLRRPGAGRQRPEHRHPVHSSARADAQAHHAEYRQVLVDSARRLSQRLGGRRIMTILIAPEKGAAVLAPTAQRHRPARPVIHQDALDHNIGWMQAFASDRGAELGAHGKTSMGRRRCFQRQLAAGAGA